MHKFVYMIVYIGAEGKMDVPTRKLFLYNSTAERVCEIMNDFNKRPRYRVETVQVNDK